MEKIELEFVTKKKIQKRKSLIHNVLNQISKETKSLKGGTGFCVSFVGSSKNNMVLKEKCNNDKVWDIDIQLLIGSKKIKKNFRNDIFDLLKEKLGKKYKCENSSSVITIKKIENQKIVESFDIALILSIPKQNKEICILDKKDNKFKWNLIFNSDKTNWKNKWIKTNKYKDKLKDEYLKLKQNDWIVQSKESYIWFVEAVNNIYNDNK